MLDDAGGERVGRLPVGLLATGRHLGGSGQLRRHRDPSACRVAGLATHVGDVVPGAGCGRRCETVS